MPGKSLQICIFGEFLQICILLRRVLTELELGWGFTLSFFRDSGPFALRVFFVCVCATPCSREKRAGPSRSRTRAPISAELVEINRAGYDLWAARAGACQAAARARNSTSASCRLQLGTCMSMHVPDWHSVPVTGSDCRWHGAAAFGWSALPWNFGPPARWHALFFRDSLFFLLLSGHLSLGVSAGFSSVDLPGFPSASLRQPSCLGSASARLGFPCVRRSDFLHGIAVTFEPSDTVPHCHRDSELTPSLST